MRVVLKMLMTAIEKQKLELDDHEKRCSCIDARPQIANCWRPLCQSTRPFSGASHATAALAHAGISFCSQVTFRCP